MPDVVHACGTLDGETADCVQEIGWVWLPGWCSWPQGDALINFVKPGPVPGSM